MASIKIKISADSTCDLTSELIQQMDVNIVPLFIIVGDDTYRDGIDITPDDIYRFVEEGKHFPRSSAVNTFDYINVFKKLSAENDAVIHINIGSDFSACHQAAVLAAKEFSNVYVVDSKNLSSGSALLIFEAHRMIQQGMQAEAIANELNALTSKIESSFVLDRLDYMHRGGRCSAVAALGISALRIKPTIEVINGKMSVGRKYHGSLDACLLKYVRDRLNGRSDLRTDHIMLTHTACPAETVEKVKQAIKQYADFKHIHETIAGCTITTHCGPNTLGILFLKK